MIRPLHFALLTAFTIPIVFSTPADAIIRRHDLEDSAYIVDAEEYPAMVDLLAPGDCIATLIAPQWLITAAHCAEHFNTTRTLSIGNNIFNVSSIRIPSSWQDDRDDIALIELTEEVTNVEPIALYTDTDEIGQQVWFVGRGDTNTGLQGQSGASVDGKTRRASNTIVAVDNWWIEFVFNGPDDDDVTAFEGISGDGDSGGPALIETASGLKIAGLSSYQDEGNFRLGTYGVREFYTRVSQYQSWISEQMGADGIAPDNTGENSPSENTDTEDEQATQGASEETNTANGTSVQDENAAPEDCTGGCNASGNTLPGLTWLALAGWALSRLPLRRKVH